MSYLEEILIIRLSPQNITLIYCIDDIVLIGPNEQEVATILESLVTYMNIREWKISPNKIQGPFTSVKFLGVQWCEACRDFFFFF